MIQEHNQSGMLHTLELALYAPTVAAAALLLHALYTMHPCTGASSSRFFLIFRFYLFYF